MVTFILPSEVIDRLRTTITTVEANLSLPEGFISFSDRVVGSGKLAELTEAKIQRLPTPSCFVLTADGVAETYQKENVMQYIYNGFDIAVVLDTEDRRHQAAEQHVPFFREIITYALNGWKPSKHTSASPLRFVGDTAVYADDSKYVRLFSFQYDTHFQQSQDALGPVVDPDAMDLFNTFYADMSLDDSDSIGILADDLHEDGE